MRNKVFTIDMDQCDSIEYSLFLMRVDITKEIKETEQIS